MFKKSSYSDLEVQEILQTLFQEKKKVTELELKFKNTAPAYPALPVENNQAELESLRLKVRELSAAHMREQENSKQLKERLEQLFKNEGEEVPQEAQFENIVQFLRKKAEEVQGENQALLKKNAQQEEINKKLLEEISERQKAEQRLQSSLASEKQHKSEILAEEESLKVQMDQLKAQLKKQLEQNQKLDTEKQDSLTKSQEQESSLRQAQQELELLKQMMMKTMQEFTEERDQEKNLSQNQIQQLKSQLEKEKNELHVLQQEAANQTKINTALKETIVGHDKQLAEILAGSAMQAQAQRELAQFTEDLKHKLVQSEEHKKSVSESLEAKELLLSSLQNQVNQLTRSLAAAEEANQLAENDKNEQAASLRVSQQHLAKKMREASALAEKYEALRIRGQELEHALEIAKTKACEAQVTLETQAKHQKAMHDQSHENLKMLESQVKKWEEKYLQMLEKWQESEARNREFKRLEERFLKLQQVLTHLNSILGPGFSLNSLETSLPELPQVKHSEQVPIPNVTTIQPSLFDSSKQAGRFKETLFG